MKTWMMIILAGLLAADAQAHPGHAHASPRPSQVQAQRVVLGSGAQAFASVPGWCQVDEGEHLGPTHGSVAVDSAGLIYVTLDAGEVGIAVYNAQGEFVRGMAGDFVGTHHLIYHEEDGTGYLYGAHLKGKQVYKLTLEGETVWTLGLPEESGKYENAGQYKPTAVAVGPDGDLYIVDGYGQNWVHQYDKDRNYIRSFGGRGREDGQFTTCHGIAIDPRGEEPRLLICDRENRRLQYFDLEGNFLSISTTDLYRPCAVSFFGEYCAVAELAGRVVVLDGDNEIISVLGDNPVDDRRANYRVDPEDWAEGIFNAPHGLSYDNEGNLIVLEWNQWGRVTFLEHLDEADAPAPEPAD